MKESKRICNILLALLSKESCMFLLLYRSVVFHLFLQVLYAPNFFPI